MYAIDAVGDCCVDCGRLRQHAVGKFAFILQLLQSAPVQVRDQRLWIILVFENAGCACYQNQLLGSERGGDLGGYRVGIDIQQGPGRVTGQWADHRHQSVIKLLLQNTGVHRIDVTDEAVVHGFAICKIDRRTAVGANQPGINATDANRRKFKLTANCENMGVDLAVEHHGADLQGILVRHAAAVDEFRFDAHCRRKLGGLWAAAVYQHDPYANLIKKSDLLHQ